LRVAFSAPPEHHPSIRTSKEQESPLAEFKNPNASGGGSQDNRSFLIMLVVMVAVIFGLQYYRSQHTPQPATPDTAVTTPTAPAVPSPAASLATSPASHTSQAPTISSVTAPTEASTVVDNELYRITFSNRGGQVTSWILKKFTDNAGHPLDLVHAGASKLYGYPLSLYTYDPALTKTLADALYVPSATGNLQAPATLSFNYASGNIAVHKTFTFGADYLVHADTVVLRDGVPIRALLSWPAGLGDMESGAAYAGAVVDTSINGKDEHEAFKKVAGGATLSGQFDFAGVSDQYFAAIFLPDAPSDASFVTLHHDIDVKEIVVHHPWYLFGSTTDLSRTDVTPASATATKGILKVPVIGAAVGDLSGHNLTRLFVGPKSLPVLKSIDTAAGNNLGPVLDFGFWGPVGKILFIGLHFVQEHMASNWGWAIVIFTVFINLLLLPLRVQGMRSMLKMQRIQPEIDLIKAKYKNPKATDPKAAEMNAEVMAYQKEKGVSMFGGCIPSLIQLPLLFAFFTMMTRVVELRHAHWGWLPDLSAADPYHILPIFMVITSFLVQFYTPSPGVDPQQQKMMAFMMPAFSGYMTWNYASGLALYWNVGNLIMIIQQTIMNRTSLGREMREIQAKRASAKLSSPKPGARTIQGRR
jgi:YidC/Oxa1 family membrane protein insertase